MRLCDYPVIEYIDVICNVNRFGDYAVSIQGPEFQLV